MSEVETTSLFALQARGGDCQIYYNRLYGTHVVVDGDLYWVHEAKTAAACKAWCSDHERCIAVSFVRTYGVCAWHIEEMDVVNNYEEGRKSRHSDFYWKKCGAVTGKSSLWLWCNSSIFWVLLVFVSQPIRVVLRHAICPNGDRILTKGDLSRINSLTVRL